MHSICKGCAILRARALIRHLGGPLDSHTTWRDRTFDAHALPRQQSRNPILVKFRTGSGQTIPPVCPITAADLPRFVARLLGS